MYHYQPSTKPNTRIDVADVLRGIAIGGIVLIHFIEHLNFYNFPEASSPAWEAVNRVVWDTTFFLLAGKMYAIFALLFGLSFYIQHDNQAQKGDDFRPRFAWRMVLLMLFGLLDLLFYNGDILFLYAVCGLLIIPLIRVCNKALAWIAFFLFLQPIELGYLIAGLINPSTPVMDLGVRELFAGIMPAQESGSWLDVAVMGIRNGLPVNFLWAIEHGRMTQTLFLFLLGIIIGRKRLFYNEGDNLKMWGRILRAGIAGFVVVYPLFRILPAAADIPCVQNSLRIMLDMWKNFTMMTVIVSGVVLLFYKTSAHDALLKIAPYGKMSLTNYIGQSVIGGLIFYNWGFGLYRWSGHATSFLLGVAVVLMQYFFCRWWLKHHKRGPLEELWRRGTWIFSKQ